MQLKDWLSLNPNHCVILSSAPGNQVLAGLHGGDGVDRRIVGIGDDETKAIAQALENRARIKAEIP